MVAMLSTTLIVVFLAFFAPGQPRTIIPFGERHSTNTASVHPPFGSFIHLVGHSTLPSSSIVNIPDNHATQPQLRKRVLSNNAAIAKDLWDRMLANTDDGHTGTEALKELKTWKPATANTPGSFTGDTYVKLANTIVDDPTYVIDLPVDPAHPDQISTYTAGEIPPKILSKFADREHLVEPQGVVIFFNHIQSMLNHNARLGTFTQAHSDALFEELAKIHTVILADENVDPITLQGDFFDLLGHALNSKANLERLIKPANILKAKYMEPSKGYDDWSETYGNVPVVTVLGHYLERYQKKMLNSAASVQGLLREVVRYLAEEAQVLDPGLPSVNVDDRQPTVSNQGWALNRLFANGYREQLALTDGQTSIDIFDNVDSQVGKTKGDKAKALITLGVTNVATLDQNNPVSLLARVKKLCSKPKPRRRRRRAADGGHFADMGTRWMNLGTSLISGGNPINDEGDFVNENNIRMDAYGDLLNEFDEPIDEEGNSVDENGDVGPPTGNRSPMLKCGRNRSFAQCRNKLNKQRDRQVPKDKEEMRNWEKQMADAYGVGDGDVDGSAKEELAQIKDVTGDEKILPYGTDAYDSSNPQTIYADSETLDDAWDAVSESFESVISDGSKRRASNARIRVALLLWKKYIRQLIAKQTSNPRENRDGLKVSEVERRGSEFNHALLVFNAHELVNPMKETYEKSLGEVTMEEVPDVIGDALRSTEEISDRSQLSALREFGNALWDDSILPEGTDGIAVEIDGDGNFLDAVAVDEGIVAVGDGGDAPATWDDVWNVVADKVVKYIDRHLADLKLSQYNSLLRGMKALKKAINFKMSAPGAGTLQKALDSITKKVQQIDRDSLEKDVNEDSTAMLETDGLVKDLDVPSVKPLDSTLDNKPLTSPSITNLAEDIAGSSAEVAEQVFDIETYQKVVGSVVDAKKFARNYKSVGRTLARNLSKPDKLSSSATNSLFIAAVSYKQVIDKLVGTVMKAFESDRGKMGGRIDLVQKAMYVHNDIAAENIIARGDGNIMLVDMGEVVEVVPADIPDPITKAAIAIRAKSELKALQALRKVDSSILPKDGYDSDVTNGGQVVALEGIGEYVRELQPSEIVDGLPEGAEEWDAWNSVTEKTLHVIDAGTGYDEDGSKALKRNAIRRYLLRAQKAISLRDSTQKVNGPWSRNNDQAILRDVQRENHADISRKLLWKLRSSWDMSLGSFGSSFGTKASSLDDRDADSVLSVDIVAALKAVKTAGEGYEGANAILPDEEPQTESPDSIALLPSSLVQGQPTIEEVVQSTVDLSLQIAGNVASEPNPETQQKRKINLMKYYSKLLKIANDARKNFALGIGRLDNRGQSSALNTARIFANAGGNVGDSFHANSVSEGVDLVANDIPPVNANEADVASLDRLSGTINRSPKGSKTWQRMLKKVLNKPLKSATGKVVGSSVGNMNK
ncbi:hypothetical protein HDV00_002984 [Rhizophlyctis rosea]|nr:hypothetical protein HDV00_002984 [Rhizophlyctis rosea]